MIRGVSGLFWWHMSCCAYFIENILTIIGWGSIILGLVLCGITIKEDNPFLGIGVYYILSGVIGGFLFFGFWEILFFN